jgi:TPR repeat protein
MKRKLDIETKEDRSTKKAKQELTPEQSIFVYRTTNKNYASGLRCIQLENYSSALAFFIAAAEENYLPACLQIVILLSSDLDESFKQDSSKAKLTAYTGLVKDNIDWFKNEAQAQNADAQYNLAVLYSHDFLGVDKDEKKMLLWAEKAFLQAHPEAAFFLGEFFLKADNKEKALSYFGFAADRGHLTAQWKFGILSLQMEDDEIQEKGIKCLQIAAEEGQSLAQCSLCVFYLLRMEEDPTSKVHKTHFLTYWNLAIDESAEKFESTLNKIALENSDLKNEIVKAMNYFGGCVLPKTDFPDRFELIYLCLNLATDHGSAEAAFTGYELFLSLCQEAVEVEDKEQFAQLAISFLHSAVDLGHLEALYQAALLNTERGNKESALKCYAEAVRLNFGNMQKQTCGNAHPEFHLQAFLNYLHQLSEEGNEKAQLWLGSLYWKGLCVEKNNTYAYDYLLKASEINVEAQYVLGQVAKEEGKFVEAMDFFKMAAKDGHKKSQYALGYIC